MAPTERYRGLTTCRSWGRSPSHQFRYSKMVTSESPRPPFLSLGGSVPSKIAAGPERFHIDRSCLLSHSLEKLIKLGHQWSSYLISMALDGCAKFIQVPSYQAKMERPIPIIARHAIFISCQPLLSRFFFTLHAQNCVQSKFRKSYSRHFRSQFLRFHSYYFDHRWSMCLSTFEPGGVRKNLQIIMIYHGIWLHFPNLQSVVSI